MLRAAIVPVGSTEQHDEHLMMLHDATSAALVARLAALALYSSVVVTRRCASASPNTGWSTVAR